MTHGPRGRNGDDRRAAPERTAGRPDPAYGPEAALAAAVVRVKGRDGVVAGAGFLVADDLVLTCAHVVSDALDRPREEAVEPGAEVAVDLPLAGGAGSAYDGGDRTAVVRRWIPVAHDRTGDMSLLRLRDLIPGARPLPLADPAEGVWHHHARAVGFTDDHPGGIWHSGTFRGPTREGWVQLSRGDGESVYVERGRAARTRPPRRPAHPVPRSRRFPGGRRRRLLRAGRRHREGSHRVAGPLAGRHPVRPLRLRQVLAGVGRSGAEDAGGGIRRPGRQRRTHLFPPPRPCHQAVRAPRG